MPSSKCLCLEDAPCYISAGPKHAAARVSWLAHWLPHTASVTEAVLAARGCQVLDELASVALVTPEELQRVIAKDQFITARPLRISRPKHALRLVVAAVVTHTCP